MYSSFEDLCEATQLRCNSPGYCLSTSINTHCAVIFTQKRSCFIRPFVGI